MDTHGLTDQGFDPDTIATSKYMRNTYSASEEQTQVALVLQKCRLKACKPLT